VNFKPTASVFLSSFGFLFLSRSLSKHSGDLLVLEPGEGILGLVLPSLLLEVLLRLPFTFCLSHDSLPNSTIISISFCFSVIPTLFLAVLWSEDLLQKLRGRSSSAVGRFLWLKLRHNRLYKASAMFVPTMIIAFACGNALVFLLAEHDITKSDVYVLYGQGCPRGKTNILSLPLILTAAYRGKEVVVCPLSIESMSLACANGEMICILGHGNKKGMNIRDGLLDPYPLISTSKSNNLRFVYIGGCEVGTGLVRWHRAVQPVQIISYKRYCSYDEVFVWMWFSAPRTLYKYED